jgi:hypothetical protein
MIHRSSTDEPSNIQRALWAKAALAVFTSETCGVDQPDSMNLGDLEDAVADLICDLLHFAKFHPRMDAEAIHGRAFRHFEQEIAEELCDCAERSWYGSYHDTQCPAHRSASTSKGGPLPSFTKTDGYRNAVFWIDNRFQVEIRRNTPPPMASAHLTLKVYPITDGTVWDEPYETFTIDEDRIVELETEMKE